MSSVPSASIEYPSELPITSRVDEIKEAIEANQVVVIAGETGSGKSTQLPKICVDLGRGTNGRIGHTQPRRLAARAVAERVAEELSSSVGDTVGYAVRFTDQVGKHTRVKLMTDGILLAEIQRDRTLSAYDTLIIDEAHERSLNIDFLLGYLKQLLPRRPDLRVVITSATIDTARFSEHFDDAPVIEVSGRTHPVEIRYRPLVYPDQSSGERVESRDQAQGICDAVVELMREGPGDVLVFCSGEREIRDAADALAELELPDTEVFPLFARLSAAEQHRVFRPHAKRRVVVATNVAETSLTVPGIMSVVDPGTARISRYNQRTKVQRLPIEPVSQASANQRAGRCGRIAPGVCIRLYSQEDFDARPEFTEPEIQRTNLSSVILQMAALGLGDIEAFPFVQPPDRRNIRDGVLVLEELGAVDPSQVGTDQWLTQLGRRLARLPIDPRLGRMIIEAADGACLAEVLVIASGLSIQDPRERPSEKQQIADEFHKRFDDERSDFLSLLHLWDYVSDEKQQRSGNQFRRMCRREFLNWSRLREWQDLHTQLRRVARDLGYRPNSKPASSDTIHQALLSGLLSHIGQIRPPEKGRSSDKRKRSAGREYLGARGSRFVLGRESMVAGTGAEWVMAGELVETNRMWARTVAPIDPLWAERIAGHLVTRSHDEPVWDTERASAVVRERVTLFGLPLVVGRRVQFVRVDPAAARALFIETALIDGRWAAEYDFIGHNERVRAEVAELEARTRRPDLSVDRSQLFEFFDARLGRDVANAKAFDRWWAREGERRPELLHLTVADAVVGDPTALSADAFPDEWEIDGHSYRVFYELDPDSDADGLTVEIPVDRLAGLSEEPFRWLVPGHRLELVSSLLRTLPRQERKAFVPVPDTALAVLEELSPASGTLTSELARALTHRSGVTIDASMFDLGAVPNHLRPMFLLLDEAGEPFLESKDLDALRDAMDERVRSTLADGDHPLEHGGLLTWPAEVQTLPQTVETGGQGHRVKAFPALVDQGDVVDLELLPSAEEQADAHWSGVRRLVRFAMPAPVKQVDRMLSNDTTLAIAADSRGRVGWYNDIIACALDSLLEAHGAPVWTAEAFEQLVDNCRAEFTQALETVVDLVENLAPAILRLDRNIEALAVESSALDARAHLDRLTYPGFLTGVGLARLVDVERYVRALEYRVARIDDGRRDAVAMAQCRRVEAEYYQLADRVDWSPELEEVAWMLEELRVSLFAQPIGTAGTVSEKRIRRALSRLS